jgi:hypothetical protein
MGRMGSVELIYTKYSMGVDHILMSELEALALYGPGACESLFKRYFPFTLLLAPGGKAIPGDQGSASRGMGRKGQLLPHQRPCLPLPLGEDRGEGLFPSMAVSCRLCSVLYRGERSGSFPPSASPAFHPALLARVSRFSRPLAPPYRGPCRSSVLTLEGLECTLQAVDSL